MATNDAGQLVWSVTLDTKFPSKGNRLTVADGVLFIPTDKAQLIAFDTHRVETDQAIKWRYNLDAHYQCLDVAVWRDYVLPGQEYLGGFPFPSGALIALSAETGDEIWRHSFDGASMSVPVVHGTVAYFTSNTGWAYAIDLEKHQALWRQQMPQPWNWAPAAPLVTEKLFIPSTRSERLVALDIASQDEAWRFEAEGWFAHPPVLADDTIFVRCWDHHIYALDASNGQIIWRHKAARDYSSDLTLDEGHIYIGAKDYKGGASQGDRAYALYILDKHTGDRVGRYEVNGHIYGRPVTTKAAVFFASDDHSRATPDRSTFYALANQGLDSQGLVGQGQPLLWEPCAVEGRIHSDLVQIENLIIAGTRQGTLVAIRWQELEISSEPPHVFSEQEPEVLEKLTSQPPVHVRTCSNCQRPLWGFLQRYPDAKVCPHCRTALHAD